MTHRERWALIPEELPNWLLKRFEDPRILDAIQLAQLRQTASGINLSQLGKTPEDFVR